MPNLWKAFVAGVRPVGLAACVVALGCVAEVDSDSLSASEEPLRRYDVDDSFLSPAFHTCEVGDALRLPNGAYAPLQVVQHSWFEQSTAPSRIAIVNSGSIVSAYLDSGRLAWSKNLGVGSVVSGFDFDQDGWPDFGLVKSASTSRRCGEHPLKQTWIEFYDGGTGNHLASVSPMDDYCYGGGDSVSAYPVSRWAAPTVMFGSDGTLALVPQYHTTGWFFRWTPTGVRSDALFYPSTPSYETFYNRSVPSLVPETAGAHWQPRAFPANGLVTSDQGSPRFTFFTNARALVFAVEDLNPDQLLIDRPFKHPDSPSGRNYGLVATDPTFEQHFVLLAGTSVLSMQRDMLDGWPSVREGFDRYGGISRHYTIFNLPDGNIAQRFYSHTHIYEGGRVQFGVNNYEGRLVYPANPFVRVAANRPSRVAYNVYQDRRWHLHISEPGSTQDRYTLTDQFLWDIRDLDNDGIEEWIISPARASDGSPDGQYFLEWTTNIYHWDEAAQVLNLRASYAEAIPYTLATPRSTQASEPASGSLYRVATVATRCRRNLLLVDRNGRVGEYALRW